MFLHNYHNNNDIDTDHHSSTISSKQTAKKKTFVFLSSEVFVEWKILVPYFSFSDNGDQQCKPCLVNRLPEEALN